MTDLISDSDIQLARCDIFLTKGTSFISGAIRWFTRRIGESRTEVNHVGIIVEPGGTVALIDRGRGSERRARPRSIRLVP